MSSAAICSATSLAAGEPLAATATTATEWLVVEVRAAWGRDALTGTELPAAAAEALASFEGRAVLVRRPDRRT